MLTSPMFLDTSTRYLARRLFKEHLWPYRLVFLLAIFFMVLAAISTVALPYLLQPVFDEVFSARKADLLVFLCGGVFLAFFLKGAASYGEAVTMTYIGQRIIADIQNRLFYHLMQADLAFFHNTPSGDLVSRFTNDINFMRNAVATTVVGIGKDALTLCCLVGLMFKQDWVLALISFFIFPLALYPIARIGRRMRKVTDHTQQDLSLFTAQLSQVFQSIRVVKAYGMEDYETNKARELIERLFKLFYKSTRVRSATHPIIETLAGAAIIAVIGYGGWQVAHESRTTGEFVSFIGALLLAYEPLKRLSNLNANLQEGLAAARRVFAVLDTMPAIKQSPHAKFLAMVQGEIIFDNVTFIYPNGRTALKNLSLLIPAGKTIAFVGASGAGKSTLINLIARFYDVTAGTISLDHTDIRELTLVNLRSNLALVSQEVILFDDTVYNNIAYGDPTATATAVLQAAIAAAADEFIVKLPLQYETIVGENGVKLSGGQRQRLAIARAMLRNAPLLLLDEATSSLDTDAERKVQGALKNLMKGRTTVMVAHRLSTVIEADIIYVLDHGELVEQGNHHSLLQDQGAYARLWRSQSSKSDELLSA